MMTNEAVSTRRGHIPEALGLRDLLPCYWYFTTSGFILHNQLRKEHICLEELYCTYLPNRKYLISIPAICQAHKRVPIRDFYP